MKKLLLILLLIFAPVFFARAQTPVKILLVPGHDNEIWGAQYGNTKEADMNLRLATVLYNILKKDKRFEVHITRDQAGYTKEFSGYFTNQKGAINAFKEKAKSDTAGKIQSGDITESLGVSHNAVNADTAVKLYGINKWADENKMDAVIHIHFNDYPRPTPWTIGKYKGFAIYMPDLQLANGAESANMAVKIFNSLKTKYTISTYPKESNGLIFDQKLIAIGANGTLDAGVRAILIEYGYIYRFRNSVAREGHYQSMAVLTAAGIKNYFFPK